MSDRREVGDQVRQTIEAAIRAMLQADGLDQDFLPSDWGLIVHLAEADGPGSSYLTLYHSDRVSPHVASGLHAQAQELVFEWCEHPDE